MADNPAMQKRTVILAVGALLAVSAGGLATAQNSPVTARANTATVDGSRTTMSGNAVITVNGVAVLADRIVINGREVTLEGNVRMTLPQGVAPRIEAHPVVIAKPYVAGALKIDTPIPPLWQPPARKTQ